MRPPSEQRDNIDLDLPQLRLLHYNVQEMSGKLFQLEVYLVEGRYDIFCVNEHWLSDDILGTVNIAGYVRLSSFSRTVCQHGGVAVFVRSGLSAHSLNCL